MAPQAGLEPATVRLTAECSTTELLRNVFNILSTLTIIRTQKPKVNYVFEKVLIGLFNLNLP